jgi:hypothetical protein
LKKLLELINEIQIQDSCSSDEESAEVLPTKTAMVFKLAQIPPEIWMTLDDNPFRSYNIAIE